MPNTANNVDNRLVDSSLATKVHMICPQCCDRLGNNNTRDITD